MKTGRNAPCPCGSGKKYKACCLKLDRENRGLRSEAPIRQAAAEAELWQADLLPFLASLEDDPGARPAAVMVTAGGFVIFSEILSRPSVEVDDIAAELERAFSEAVARIGVSPPAVEVREAEVAAVLEEKLRRAGWPTRARAAHLADVEQAMASLNQHMGAPARAIVPSMPQTWAGWGLPDDWVAEVFRRSAELYRVRPWEGFDGNPVLLADTPAGGHWYVVIMGGAEMEYGLGLYSDPQDIEDLADDPSLSPAGRILGLTFESGRRLPRPMRKEIARAGWKVAAADAYPMLMVYGTPAGGLRRRDAEDLVAVLAAVAAWSAAVERDQGVLDAPWRDPESGVELELEDPEFLAVIDLPPLLLEPGDAEGPGARAEAALERMAENDGFPQPRQSEWLDPFVEELAGEGLSARTVDGHAGNAALFLDYLENWAPAPVEAVHEFDLRTFLFDWYPRKVAASRTEASRMTASLRRLFDFLRRRAGVHCPWAAGILKDKKAFLDHWDRSPVGPWWDEDVAESRVDYFDELERRAFFPSDEVPGVFEWGAAMGLVEATLHQELQRRWLIWRDEVIRGGIRQSNEVWAVLHERERYWLTTPHATCGGKTPVEAIEAERRERPPL